MNEQHLLASVRYVELNPVRAKLCLRPEDWHWSSAREHLGLREATFVRMPAMTQRIGSWREYLDGEEDKIELDAIRRHVRTGRPSDDAEFLKHLELLTGRELAKKKPSPKVN